MTPPLPDPEALAAQFAHEAATASDRSTAALRRLRREYTRRTRTAGAPYVMSTARALLRLGYGWAGWELVRYNREAFQALDAVTLEGLGQIDSWDTVDGFARVLAGPAWLAGLIGDGVIEAWARSPNLWWRRAALVCTVALNLRSQVGYGDTPRTLHVCELLAADRERMVQQALSWALRELVVHDPGAVSGFLDAHTAALDARTKREVRHKLSTGLKNPRRRPAMAS